MKKVAAISLSVGFVIGGVAGFFGNDAAVAFVLKDYAVQSREIKELQHFVKDEYGKLELELNAFQVASRFPDTRLLQSGRNAGEKYIQHFVFDGLQVFAQLDNFENHPVSVDYEIILLDQYGGQSGSAREVWSFHKLNPGASKNQKTSVIEDSGGSPVYYLIRFR